MLIGPLIANDDLLLALVGASATLLGLFLVGVFFFVDSPVRRSNPQFEAYLRTGTSIVLLLYAIPLIVPLVLIAVGPIAASILFAVLSVALILQNVRTVWNLVHLPRGERYRALLVNEIASTGLGLIMVALPWVLGGLRPSREQLAASLILALVAAFVSTCALVMSTFDLPTPAEGGRRRISRIRLRR